MVTATYAVQMSYDAAVVAGKLQPVTWTTTPVDAESGIHVRRGITGTGPTDRLAGPGTLEFALLNSPIGVYSPGHANVRSGWGYGVPVRLVGTYGIPRVLFTGRVRTIAPAPGLYRSRLVQVTVQDCLADLADGRLGDLAVQVNATDAAILAGLIAAIPAAIRPTVAATLASDTYPYALDDLQTGPAIITALTRLVLSSWAKLYATADNVLTYRTRGVLATQPNRATLLDTDLDDLAISRSLATSYNRVRVTVTPRRLGAPGTVLFASASPIAVSPKETITVWGTYQDPTNATPIVGGTAFLGLTVYTDVIANTLADGTGGDYTLEISGGSTGFATTAKFEITNNSREGIFLTTLQIRGTPIYADAPLTAESYVVDARLGDQTLEFALGYQTDVNVAQDLADYVRRVSAALPVQTVTINPQRSATLMTLAHVLDVCDVLTLNEPMTGLVAQPSMVHAIDFAIAKGQLARVTYTVVPLQGQQAFILDHPVYGVLDQNVLGFAA